MNFPEQIADPPRAVRRQFKPFSIKDTRRATILATLAWIFAVYDYILFGTLLPEIAKENGWSASTATAISTWVSVGTFIVIIIIGPITDRIGRRKGMMLTVGGTAISSALSAIVPGASSLVAVRSLGGMGLSEQNVNATYLNEIYEVTEDEAIKKRKGFIYSLVQGGWPIGCVLAALFVYLLMTVWGTGWREVFAIAAVPALIIAIACRKLRESPQFEVQHEIRKLTRAGKETDARALADSYGVDYHARMPLSRIFQGAERRNTVMLSLASIFNWMGIQVFAVLGTTILVIAKGATFGEALLFTVITNGVGYLGYLFFGWAGDKWGRKNVVACGWLVAGIVFALMLTVAEGNVQVVGLFAIGQFCLIGPYSALNFLMAECYPDSCRATGAVFIGAMSQPGAIIGGLLLTAIIAAGVATSTEAAATGTAALIVGALGTFISGLLMFGVRHIKERTR